MEQEDDTLTLEMMIQYCLAKSEPMKLLFALQDCGFDPQDMKPIPAAAQWNREHDIAITNLMNNLSVANDISTWHMLPTEVLLPLNQRWPWKM